MRNPWLSLSLDLCLLGMEAQRVVFLRTMKLGGGGVAAAAEAELMVTEKLRALVEVQAKAASAVLTGKVIPGPARSVAHYRRLVRANARRLSK